jgi:two-component system, sensor histidine kinase
MNSSENFEASASESFFRNLLETAPDAMVIVDRRGRIAIVNSQAERMFGYLREELYGEPIEILLPEKMRYSHMKSRSGYSVDPHVRPMGRGMVLTGLRKDGSEFPVEISLSPVVTDGGSFVSSVIRDVTERKELEREIIDARRSAERANQANTAFLAAASHDLRQPVQALSLLNGALRRTVESSLALEMIDSQQQSLDAMTNLLNSLLDISRLDAGAVAPEIEVFPIQRLIDRLAAEFARQAGQKGLDFHIEPSDILVESDPNLLGEIIQNFVSNAIRYTARGSVKMQCEQTNGNVCIRISDTGIGIEAEHIEDIFAEFRQLKAPGQKNEGFGLGLAIVQRLSNLLGHKIEVSSEPGSGSEFSVCLPAIGAHKREQAVELSSRDATSEGGKFGTIILIEDDSSVANALVALLEAEGYRVAIAASAQEAKTIARHIDATPDLIVTDFHLLDGSTGIEAVVDLRELFESDIPALIVTGDTSIVVQEARKLPNSILIRKPVNPDQLLRDADIAVETGKVSTT